MPISVEFSCCHQSNVLGHLREQFLERLSVLESSNRALRHMLRDEHEFESGILRLTEERDSLERKLKDAENILKVFQFCVHYLLLFFIIIYLFQFILVCTKNSHGVKTKHLLLICCLMNDDDYGDDDSNCDNVLLPL